MILALLRKLARRASILATHLADCSLPHLSTTAATDHMRNAEFKQEMLLHKIEGAFWDGSRLDKAPSFDGAALPRD